MPIPACWAHNPVNRNYFITATGILLEVQAGNQTAGQFTRRLEEFLHVDPKIVRLPARTGGRITP